MTDSARILARQLSNNAVATFADRERKRTRQTFQDAWIADQIERLLLEIAPLQCDVDPVKEGTELGSAHDSDRSKAVEAVSEALQSVDVEKAAEQPKEPEPSPDEDAGRQDADADKPRDVPQFIKGDPAKAGDADKALAEIDRLIGKAA